MARAHSSSTAFVVATVLFAFLFVFSLILAIIFYSRVAKAEQGEAVASDALRRFVSRDQEGQQRLITLTAAAAEESTTVYGLLDEETSTLKAIVNGKSSADVENIRSLWSSLVSVEGRPLVEEVEQLNAELKQARTRINELESEVDSEKGRAREAFDAQVQTAQVYEDATRKDEQNYNTLRDDLTDHQQQNEATLEQIGSDFGSKLTATQTDRDSKKLQVDQQQSRIRDLEKQVKNLQDMLAQREQRVTNIVPVDGLVEALLPDEGRVLIDLGRRHHIQPGMSFEVYGRNELVKIDHLNELAPRGKATVEVIEASEVSSTARIARLERAERILEGDNIYNVVFDKDWVPMFYVHGQFDIDQTGQATRTDRRRVETMIREYRGEIADELTYEVDYLLLGVEPDVPRPPPPNEIDPAVIERYTDALKRFESYQELIATAKKLTIPILNQNRFLNLVGYYQR